MSGLLFVSGVLAVFLALPQATGTATPAAPRPAVPLDPKAAILDAFRSYSLVAIGDAHGDVLGEAFQLALIRDPRFATAVNDIIIESGNSRYQEVVDRYVTGEEIARAALERVWIDTNYQQVASPQVSEVVLAVRSINASLPKERRVRVLLGEPPIDWTRIQTSQDMRRWEDDPISNRDRFAADVIRKEVLAKGRRGLALYGAGHFFRRVISESMVTVLEASGTKVFTIWTNAAAEMAKMQADVTTWPVPSLALLRGTVLGRVGLSDYFGPGGGDIPPQWRAPLEDQFDAVLYLGALATLTLARPQPWRCADPLMAERLRRLRLMRPQLAERVEGECVR